MQTARCFARGHDGSWEGLCVDYDIAVQGNSFEEVRRDLADAVQSYVAFAQEQDAATQARLLSRRSPWHVQLLWRQ